MRSPQTWQLDTRRAPWIFYCLVVGLGLFLLHNLIDFSWFEAGPMAMFMLLIGAAMGMAATKECALINAASKVLRSSVRNGKRIRSISAPQGGRPVIIAITIAALAGWVTAAILFVGPVVFAEGAAAAANDSITNAPADGSVEEARHYAQAARLLAAAAATIPYNPEYTFRQAKALLGAGDLAGAESLVQRAKKINPLYIDAYLLDANLQLKAEPKPDANRVRSDFDTIIRLNPNDVPFHVQYAQALDRFGDHRAAARQYDLAIGANAALPVGEPRRLTPEQLADLREHLLHDELSH
jgi:tetratricopeptide (TPR) repeat protein